MGWDPQAPGDKQGHLFTWVGRSTPGHAACPSSETQEGRSSAVLLGPGAAWCVVPLPFSFPFRNSCRTSPKVQGLTIRLPMQGAPARSPDQEGSTGHRATRPEHRVS